jgi:D-aminopeptidase
VKTKIALAISLSLTLSAQPRPRAREAGVQFGTLPPGPLNAITDVPGVRVGHATLRRDNRICTGVTAVLPHDGNLYTAKVAGAVFTGNGFGKLMGSTQVNELGEVETPILLTSTLNVPKVADALLDWMLALPGNETARSVNPLVAETNDGYLSDIRRRPLGKDEVFAALRSARGGPVEEGAVGAGAGTVAFGFKGGIGTSSRRTPAGHVVGVLVQTNYGGDLLISGVPVGRELRARRNPQGADGSVIVVVATDASVDHRNLMRMASRAMMGLGRTGAAGSNGSGDYAIAFSTWRGDGPLLKNDEMSPLFLAVIEATEEAVVNSLFRAQTTTSNGHTVEALPLDETLRILRDRGAIR